MSQISLAIDFGTSNSLVGAAKDKERIEALPLDLKAADPTLMRTLLYFRDENTCFYGQEAISQYLENDMEGRLFRSFKSHLPNKNYLGTYVNDRVLTLESMVGIFLLELKKRAEKHFEQEVQQAVIGRPARYSMDPIEDEFALYRMSKAAEFAGFKKVSFVPEPLAAALDYRRQITSEKIVLIGDFGGGTSDFTIIKLGPFAFKKEHVLSIEGCPLAGDSLDSLFMSQKLNAHFGAQSKYKMLFGSNVLTMPKLIVERLNHPSQIVHLKDRSTFELLKDIRKGTTNEKDKERIDQLFALIEDQQIYPFFESIEKTKRTLSENDKTLFEFEYPGINVKEEFSKTQFEDWAVPNKEKIFAALDRAMTEAQVSPQQIDLVTMTGGTAQVPFIKQELIEMFGQEKLQTQSHFHSVLSGLVESARLES